MATLSAKPGLRYSVSDWDPSNKLMSDTAEQRRHISHETRQEGRILRNETTSKVRCCDYVMKQPIHLCALSRGKEETERAITVEVMVECLTLREGRPGNELVSDLVEVIDGAQQVLQQRIDKAFEELFLLQESRQQLTHEPRNKMEAQDIDLSCFSTTSQQEDMRVTRVQLRNELKAQCIATEFAICECTRHLEQARDETQWSYGCLFCLSGLEDDLQAKMAPLNLVHTWLENRTKRPGLDLCRDEVQYGLVVEDKHLEATILALKQILSNVSNVFVNYMSHVYFPFSPSSSSSSSPGTPSRPIVLCLSSCYQLKVVYQKR
uniref:Tektin n=1 Tax=Hucho hucho TaxID=62062 RepID=A0A4W5PPS9_9TELE